MPDPLKLAEEIEQADDPDCAETPFLLFERHRKLVAAALRLAELTLRVEDDTAGVGGSMIENSQYDAIAAYRAAREGK